LPKLTYSPCTSGDSRLRDCGVTDEGCAALASALRSNPSHLREVNLSWNKLGDAVKLLSDALRNPHCKLETLWTLSIQTSVQFPQDQLMAYRDVTVTQSAETEDTKTHSITLSLFHFILAHENEC
uniref:Uncharacterized protein n=1 Tax=Sinocyclocheilus anshuiensis TaxID=1608454 RepID=A0A671M696_9TELE